MAFKKLSKNKVRDNLHKIETGFDKAGDESGSYTVDNFSSFLYTKEDFPINTDIEEHIKNNFTPMSINKRDEEKDNEKKDDKGFFLKDNLVFSDKFFDNNDFNNNFMFVGLNAAERAGETNYSGWKNFHDTKKPTNTYRLYIQTNDKIFKGCYITDIIKSFTESDSGHVMRNFFIGNDLSFLKDEDSTSKAEVKAKRIEKLAEWQFKDETSKVRQFFRKIKDGDIYKYNDYKFEVNKVESLIKTVDENKDILTKSMDCFIQECLAVEPKHLVVFGKDAEVILKEMSESNLFRENVVKRLEEMQNEGKPFSVDKDVTVNDVMDLVRNSIEVTHYSTQSVPNNNPDAKSSRSYKFKDWFAYAPNELLNKGTNALKNDQK